MRHDTAEHLPLSPATLHVLLALTAGELHGYAIMVEVTSQSGVQYRIGPGTLYDNLKKLLNAGLVEELDAPGDGRTRRKYRLTELGNGVLAAEVERLSGVLREARRALKLSERRS